MSTGIGLREYGRVRAPDRHSADASHAAEAAMLLSKLPSVVIRIRGRPRVIEKMLRAIKCCNRLKLDWRVGGVETIGRSSVGASYERRQVESGLDKHEDAEVVCGVRNVSGFGVG